MKKLLILILFSIPTIVLAQSTYTVDSKANSKADFKDLQTAINTVSAGSTLLVQGSPNSYGELTIEKPIIIKGTGYFLGENANTKTDFSESKVSKVTFKTNSNGSVISGMYCTGSFEILEDVSNISFIRNRVISITGGGSNHMVKQNYIQGLYRYINFTGYYYSIKLNDSEVTGNFINQSRGVEGNNLILINNFMSSSIDVSPSNNDRSKCSAKIVNSSVSNNILYSSAIPTNFNNSTDTNCGNSLINNVYYHPNVTSPTTDDNNNKLTNINPFIEDTDDRYSTDGRYILSSDSPAKGAGVGGVDCGMFAGGYVLSGLPDIPNIYEFNVPTTGYSNSTGLQINVKVKSNN